MQPIVLRFKVDMLAVILKKARTCCFPSCRVQKGWPMLLQGSRNDPQSFYGMYSMARNDGHFSLSQIRTESSFKFSSSSVGSFPISLLSHFLSATSKYLGFSPKNYTLFQGQAGGIWTYHSSKFEIWLYHEGPTLQSRITQKWLELSLSFFHIMKIWDICGHLQLV